MSRAKADLAELQAKLKAAEAAVARDRREEDRAALRDANTVGRAAKEEFDRLDREFRSAVTATALAKAAVLAASAAIREHEATEPQPLDFATEEETATWARQLNELVEKRIALAGVARAEEFRQEKSRMAAIGAHKRLEHAQYVVLNLTNKIADPEHFGREFPPGGVSGV